MCGITGFWEANPLQERSSQILDEMMDTLEHRGPDGKGSYLERDKGLAMGHTRLSIIDLETGSQPLFNRDKSIVLTANGEFYDYKRIRSTLVLDGATFTTKSDSEIAIQLYQRKGLDCIHELRGEFAFALFDDSQNRLTLARDRFGIKPLFYHIKDGNLYWGSEVKSLFANPNVPRSFDSQAVLHQLMHTMILGTSAFKDVHAVKPGHMITFQRNGNSLDVHEETYWDVSFPEERPDTIPDEHYIQSVREKLLESVQLRLEADVPVGCYLSGGIDSCSMLGLASSVQQSPVKAYTISFDHDNYDEASIAKEMAARVQADQELLQIGADELYGDNYIKTLWHSERTFYNTLGVAKWCMSKRVRESGYKVVVTGEGADELFGGYPAFKRDMFRFGIDDESDPNRAEYQKQMDKSNALFKGAILAESWISHPELDARCGFTPSWIQPWMHTLQIARPLLHDDLLNEIQDYDPIAAIAQSFNPDQITNRHPLDVSQYTWIKTMLECQILNWGGDRVDMANSMESRPAFLDHHVAEAAREIPPTLRIKGNIEKWVLREAMKHVLPEVLYKREKFAFMAPPSHTEPKKKRALQKLIDEYMDDSAIKTVGLFDPERLTAFLDSATNETDPVTQTRNDALLNHVLGLHVLHRQFIQQK